MYPTSRTNGHHDNTILEVDEMVLNVGNLIYQEQVMSFSRNKKILKLFLKDYIFRSYHFSGVNF